MKEPIAVTVDQAHPVAYVRYLRLDAGEGSYEVRRDHSGHAVAASFDDAYPWTGVLADIGEDDAVIGIEILDVRDPALVALARDFAQARGLAFPSDFSDDAAHASA